MAAETPLNASDLTGLILAGGQARRLGGVDKGLVPLGGRPLVEWAIRALEPQVGALLVNANRRLDLYRGFGHPVIPDREADHAGPLAGIASALAVAPTGWVLCVPCDTPLVPGDLASRLAEALLAGGADLAAAHDGTRLQPLHALIPVRLAGTLGGFLKSGGSAVREWYQSLRLAVADYSDRPEAFANVNTWEELRRMEQHLAARG